MICKVYYLWGRFVSWFNRKQFKGDITIVPQELKQEYRTYLKSDTWNKLRKEAVKRDRHRCVRCGYIGNLQVHHINYNGIYENFNFSVSQLVTLCNECHKDEHKPLQEGKGSTL